MRMRSWIPAAALAVLALVLTTLIVVVTTDTDHRPAGDSAGSLMSRAVTDWDGQAGGELSEQHREVMAAARKETMAFLDVDYRDMEPRIEAVLDGATGDFAKEYADRRGKLVEAAKKYKSVSTGKVVAVGVGDLDKDSAVVFVAANSEVQSVTTEGSKQPRYYRLQLDLVREGSAWKTAQVRFVG